MEEAIVSICSLHWVGKMVPIITGIPHWAHNCDWIEENEMGWHNFAELRIVGCYDWGGSPIHGRTCANKL